MREIAVGDDVEVKGDTQDYILSEPEKTYRGRVIGKESGQLLVRLDEAVVRGTGQIHETSVPEGRARRVGG